MTDSRIKEAFRYLGYGRNEVDEKTKELVNSCFQELEEVARIKSIYQIFRLVHVNENVLRIGNMEIESKSLGRNLRGCDETVLLGATLGIEVDRLLARYSLTDMAKAVVLQACAAAYLEEYLDDLQLEMEEELNKENLYLRPRFSPGYGDFDISHQDQILLMLDTAKRIGLTRTESYMLTPTKSVTAVIGVSKTKENCHIKGCESCEKTDCVYRRN